MSFSITIGFIENEPVELRKGVKPIPGWDDEEDEEDTDFLTPCEGEEPEDLVDREYTIDKGTPCRSPSYSGWGEFMDNVFHHFGPEAGMGWYLLAPYKEEIEQLEERIPTLDTEINKDRAKWLVWWSKKAIELYGNRAAIKFT